MRVFWLMAAFLVTVFGQAQSYQISGYVRDASSGEELIGANVYTQADVTRGATTNSYGYYSFTLPEGTYQLVAAYLGYQKQVIEVELTEDKRLNIDLQPSASQLEEVTVKAERENSNITTTDVSTEKLQMEQVEKIPAFAGEVDIMKTIQLLPGVQSAGEGNTGLYVRGGGPDQNLILLDEAIVYNPGHLFGFFSVFNGDAIKSTTLIKGGIPAEYGGRLSSVVDISMNEGSNQNYRAEGGIGLISSRLMVEGPIVEDKSSFMVSGRRTYLDFLLQPFIKDTELEGNSYYFYDLNAKANYKFSDQDRLFLSGYFGRDEFGFTSESGDFNINIPWGNATGTARWNHLFSDKLFMNASLIYNRYDFTTRGEQLNFKFSFNSEIEDIGGKVDFDWFISNNTQMKFGLNYTNHKLAPITASVDASEDDFNLESDRIGPKYAHEGAAYVSLETDFTARLRATVGLRASGFQQIGPYTYYEENEREQFVDTTEFAAGEPVATFGGLEPRLSMRYMLTESASIKASYMRTKQYLHLVSNSNASLPTDVWVPSSKLVDPETADQVSIGFFKNFADNKIESSVEVYYKWLQDQIEFEDGYIPGLNNEVERNFVFGRGYSYGAEFYLKKKVGDLTGWIGYTYSKTDRIFPDINNGDPFPAKYDRRHDLSIVGLYEINDRWTVSGTFVYGTGNTSTLPESWYLVENNITAQYGERNSYRMQPYHRLDLSATLHGRERKRFQSDWVFSIYNVYSRLNPFFIFFETEGSVSEGNAALTAKQVSIFPIIPSITWNFKLR